MIDNENQISTRSIILSGIAVFISCMTLTACGTHYFHQPLTQPATSFSSSYDTNRVTGVVVQADGVAPAAGIKVYIPSHVNLSTKVIRDHSITSSTAPNNNCQKPIEPYISYTCTDSNGHFSLNIPTTARFPVSIKMQSNQDSQVSLLALDDLDSHLGVFQFDPQTNTQRQKIAIVADLQGTIDPIKETLNERMTDSAEIVRMELAQGFLKLYDIDDSINEVEFPKFSSLFNDSDGDKKSDLFKYNVIYLNSQNENGISELSSVEKKALLEFVKNGGELYFTSWQVEIEDPAIDQYI